VGGVGTVRLRWGSGSLVGRLGRRPCGYARVCFGFRVWRILGGGKIRQTLCVRNLAKILLKIDFILFGGGEKTCPDRSRRIYKRYFCSASSVPAAGKILRERTKRLGSRIPFESVACLLYSTHQKVVYNVNIMCTFSLKVY